MSIQIVVSMIAFLGVIISVVASIVTNRRITSVEIKKIHQEMEQKYTARLLEKRLEVYPEFHHALSDFVKLIERRQFSKQAVVDLRKKTDDWDSRNAVFLGARVGSIVYEFRMTLAQLEGEGEQEIEQMELLKRVGEVELALKSELGVYAFDSPDSIKRFKSYPEMVRSLRGSK
jgi:hypothetical protein